MTASITDGVLTLHIPQPEARKPRRIEIATGGAQPRLATGETHADFSVRQTDQPPGASWSWCYAEEVSF